MSEYDHLFNKHEPSLAEEASALEADTDESLEDEFYIPQTRLQTDHFLNHFRTQEEIQTEQDLHEVSQELVEIANKIKSIYNEYNGNPATLTPDNPVRNNFIKLTFDYKKLIAKYDALLSRLLSLNPMVDISKYPKQ